MENKQSNLAAFNEWVCVRNCPDEETNQWYMEGQRLLFHEDQRINREYFKLVVDETDTPIKKLVRWD